MSVNTYTQDSDPVIATAAQIVAQALIDHAAGKLTRAEYEEIVHDCLSLAYVEQCSGDMIRRQNIVNAFTVLAKVADIIIPII